MTLRSSLLLGALLAALAVPGTASAATVSAAGGTLTFTAASGESNNLTVSVQSGLIRFEDTGVSSMTAGSGCTTSGAQRVNCVQTAVTGITTDLGDGNDRLNGGVLLPFSVYGGLGNDQITLFAGDDVVDAGPGNDVVDTGWGDDTIDGGDGADTMSGGAGDDAVVYATRLAGVTVSLDDLANDGASGEGDNVRLSVDDVVGGSGNDSFTGDAGGNDLTGNGGDDVLDGAGGDDTLDGGAGADSFSGGAGADTLRARDGVLEAVVCGSDPDAAEADHDDSADPDCEVVNRDAAPVVPVVPPVPVLPPSPTGGTGSIVESPIATIAPGPIAVSAAGVAPVPLHCPSEAFQGCAGVILVETLDSRGSAGKLDVEGARRLLPLGRPKHRRLASRRFKAAAGQDRTVPVRLDRSVWRRYSGRRRVKVKVTVTMENAGGTTTSTQTVTFKPRSARRG
jgi:hypothetical protein